MYLLTENQSSECISPKSILETGIIVAESARYLIFIYLLNSVSYQWHLTLYLQKTYLKRCRSHLTHLSEVFGEEPHNFNNYPQVKTLKYSKNKTKQSQKHLQFNFKVTFQNFTAIFKGKLHQREVIFGLWCLSGSPVLFNLCGLGSWRYQFRESQEWRWVGYVGIFTNNKLTRQFYVI